MLSSFRCGHCKRLLPTWETLAETFKESEKLVVAKMDATTNDVSPGAPFQVTGFPTIKFKPAGTREFHDYDGDRSLEDLIEFVKKHAKHEHTPKIPPAVPEPEEETTSELPEGLGEEASPAEPPAESPTESPAGHGSDVHDEL